MPSLQQQFGPIDIYLFDQLLRNNIMPGMRVLDAGCGSGRNLVYLLREGYEVFGSDQNPEAIAQTRALVAALAPISPRKTSASNPSNPSPTPTTPSTSSSAAPSSTSPATTHTSTPCSKAFGASSSPTACSSAGSPPPSACPTSTSPAIATSPPDGVERYCVDEALLMRLTKKLGAQLVDPIKTTVVQNQRCMTTWIIRNRPRQS